MNFYYDKLLLSIVKYQITMQDNKLIVLLVVVLHIKDAVLSKKSKMSYNHPPYKFRYQFIRNRETILYEVRSAPEILSSFDK